MALLNITLHNVNDGVTKREIELSKKAVEMMGYEIKIVEPSCEAYGGMFAVSGVQKNETINILTIGLVGGALSLCQTVRLLEDQLKCVYVDSSHWRRSVVPGEDADDNAENSAAWWSHGTSSMWGWLKWNLKATPHERMFCGASAHSLFDNLEAVIFFLEKMKENK